MFSFNLIQVPAANRDVMVDTDKICDSSDTHCGTTDHIQWKVWSNNESQNFPHRHNILDIEYFSDI